MQIYLPIAEMSVSVWLIVAMGAAVGFVTGMFGIGGGFLMTPFLIFTGVTPAVAVATGSSQIVASSVSGIAAQVRRGGVDFMLALVLVAGGIPGSFAGVWLVSVLRELGQTDLVIKFFYFALLGIVGSLMLSEAIRTLMRARRKAAPRAKASHHYWVHGLPLKMRFRVSKLYISAIPPVIRGFFSGVLSGGLGVGGGFVMVPAMIYILRMPASTVVGTSLFQVLCISILSTFLQAWINQTVDVVLAVLLMIGGVIGVQYGSRIGARLRYDQLRLFISLLIVGMALRFGWELVSPPVDVYSLALPGDGG